MHEDIGTGMRMSVVENVMLLEGPTMNVVALSWYTSFVLLFGAFVLSFITVAPGDGLFFIRLFFGFAAGGIAASISAVVLSRKPPRHWVHTSKPFFTLFFAIATASTLVVALIG